ncbi:MAG: sulfatase-like hydrolase/transferase [Selenomonadaceae bacterium]|nr:sulfatase-like hydrolase/transferase [Selenomonadaceae bacterium]
MFRFCQPTLRPVGRLGLLGIMFGSWMVWESLIRLLIGLRFYSELSWSPLDFMRTFLLGLVYDASAGVFFCLPVALFFLLPAKYLSASLGKRLGRLLVFLLNGFMVGSGVTLFFYFQEFHTCFNFIAVDYLIYSSEMLGTIQESFPLGIIVPVMLVITFGITWLQLHRRDFTPQLRDWRQFVTASVVILLLPVMAVVLPQSAWRLQVAADKINQELAGNGPYEFVRAYFTNELDYDSFYAKEANTTALCQRLRSEVKGNNEILQGDDGVTRRVENQNELTGRKPNVVLITVESFSADYAGFLGFPNSLTPNLDEVAQKSLSFTRLYATGTRTVRGLEALSLSVPPTPGQSIVRRQDNSNMEGLGDAFRQNGYQIDFIYGGYGYFDNMNDFFAGNGYTVKDRNVIPEEEIHDETVWGVPDEILFDQVVKSLDEHQAKGEPAFEMVLTTSNHRPFKFPKGRIDAPQGVRSSVVRYTDWAIKDFLDKAAKKPWFDNTVFVIVADHQALAAGKADLPVNRYHIPCLIYAPKLIKAGQCNRLMSQIDVGPTLLGLLGMSYTSRFFGHDVFNVPESADRAFISTYQLLGLVKDDQLTILSPNQGVKSYRINDWSKADYTPIPTSEEMRLQAVSWYQGANMIYHEGLLKAPQ